MRRRRRLLAGGLIAALGLLGWAGCRKLFPAADPEELADLLGRAKAQGLVTSIEEIAESYVASDDDSSPIYHAIDSLGLSGDFETLQDYFGGRATAADAERALEDAAEYVKELEAAASKADFTPLRNMREPYSAFFPGYAQIKAAAQVFAARALLRAEQGKPDEALGDMALAANVVRHANAERFLIARFMCTACIAIWARGAQKTASVLHANAETLQRLSELAAHLPEPDYKEALGFEIASARQTLRLIKRRELSGSELPYGGGLPSGEENSENPFVDSLFRSRADQAEILFIRHIVEVVEVWHDPARVRALSEENERLLGERWWDPAAVFAAIYLPDAARLVERELETTAILRAARIALAAAHIRAKTGEWPTLADAARAAGVPTADPFDTAREMAYLASEGGLLVYSVGPNGKDDGGSRRDKNRRVNFDVGVFEIMLK